jgi:hypothetical protein
MFFGAENVIFFFGFAIISELWNFYIDVEFIVVTLIFTTDVVYFNVTCLLISLFAIKEIKYCPL